MKTLELYGMDAYGYYFSGLTDGDRQALERAYDLNFQSATYGLTPSYHFYSFLESEDAAVEIIDSLRAIHDYFFSREDFCFTYDNNLSPVQRTAIEVHIGVDSMMVDVNYTDSYNPEVFVSDMYQISKRIEKKAHHTFNLDIHMTASVPVFAEFTFVDPLELWLFFRNLSFTDMDFQIMFE